MRAEKKIYLEIIRIIALTLVIFNHTADKGYMVFANTPSFFVGSISIVLSCISKAGVPLFFMISGALLLNKEERIRDLYLKRVLKMLVILFVFSLIYYVRLFIKNPEYGFSIKFFLRYIYEQPMVLPLWYMYSYLAFLVALPFFRKMATGLNDAECRYYIALCILAFYLLPTFECISGWNRYFSIPLMGSNIVYPLLGYIIANRSECIRKYKKLSFTFLTLNFIWVVILTYLSDFRNGAWNENFIENGALIVALFIFDGVKTLCETKDENIIYLHTDRIIYAAKKTGKPGNLIEYIGSCCFCIYLLEEMLRVDGFVGILDRIPSGLLSLAMCVPYILLILITGVIISSILDLFPSIRKLGL